MQGELVNGVALPSGWRRYSLDDLIALASRHGVIYWVDEEVIARQIRQAIVAASEVGHYMPPLRRSSVKPEREALYARAAAMRDSGEAWALIASELGYNATALISGVKGHCRRVGRSFPSPPKTTDQRAEQALTMRRSTPPPTWQAIADELGYPSTGCAHQAVASYCKKTGEDFPTYKPAQRGVCKHGHVLHHVGMYVRPDGSKECRQCKRDAKMASQRRRGVSTDAAGGCSSPA